MDAELKAILKNLPAKKLRSRLEPYRELIREMRRRGRSYREIIQVLNDECDLQVSVSTLHDFVRLRSMSTTIAAASSGGSQNVNARKMATEHSKNTERIRSEQRSTTEHESYTTTNKALRETPAKRISLFNYNAEEPLRLAITTAKNMDHKS